MRTRRIINNSEVFELAEKTADRRTLKTRKALYDALADLLTEKKLHKVTVQEIADKANVNRVTFYRHFLDVYDLYEKLENETLVELGILVLGLEDLPEEEFFSCFIGYICDNATLFRMVFSPNSTGELRDKLSKLIEGVFRQIQSEKMRSDISDKELEYMCSYRAQGCLALISKWVLGGFEEPKEFIVATASKLDGNTEKIFSSKPVRKK